MPAPPVVASVPGAHFAPSHFKTCPDWGATVVVSTSLKKSTLNALKLIVTLEVSVAIAVAILVPPNTLSVDSPDAITCPSSLTTVLNVSPLPEPPV